MDQTANQEVAIHDGDQMPSWREVFLYFLFLGFVNVGGPVAQITMMFNHMVEKRRWLTKDRFVKIMAFCHMLPGPEALQLAIYVGYLKRRFVGGILAGITFILPGAAVMILLSWLYVKYGKLPLRRAAEPAEIARHVAWLASEENSYLTGQVVTVDGGLTVTF